MTWLSNFIFLVAGGGVVLSACLRHSWRLLWLLFPLVLVAALYNAVTPLAVRRVNLDFVTQVAREAPELEHYHLEAREMERIYALPISFNQISGDYDEFVSIKVDHPWDYFLQFTVDIQFLLKNEEIVAVLPSIDRKNSSFFSGFSTGPDRVHVPDFVSRKSLEGAPDEQLK